MILVNSRRLYLLYGSLLVLNITCLARQNTQPQNSNVVLTVSRGRRTESDWMYICPAKPGTELDSRYIESKTMNCSDVTDQICDQSGGARCACQLNTPTYVVSQKRCVNNIWLRQGCTFRFGSWRHSTGWIWNKKNDPPLSLFLDDGYGIVGGFNASNTQFERCTLTNITVLTKTGDWGKIDHDSSDITFYVDKRYYHISWNTENLGAENRKQIRGRILKFSIKCQPPEPTLHNDIAQDPTESCLVFKATGNFTITPAEKSNKDISEGTEDNTTAIALGVTFSILLIAGIVIAVVCYKRRTSRWNTTPRFLSNFTSKFT